MSSEQEVNEIALEELFAWVLKGKWIIVAFLIVGIVGSSIFTLVSYDPLYKATASIVVNAKDGIETADGEFSQSAADIYLAQKMLSTYSVVFESNRVMEYVIDDLNLDIEPDVLREWVELSPVRDTQVLLMSVVSSSPELAMDIANSLIRVAPQAMMETVERGSLNVLDEARMPKQTIPPRTFMNGAIGAVLGLMLGLAFVIVSNAMSPRVRNTADVESRLEMKTIGEIPHAEKEKGSECLLYTDIGRAPMFVDALFYIRTILEFLFIPQDIRTVMVTSAMAGEGKTTVISNLALALSESGKSVLVIDADLRKPSLHEKFGLEKARGNHLVNLLKGEVSQTEAIFAISKNLHVLRGAEVSAHESKMTLGSSDMKSFLEEMHDKYDYVLIDTPPVCAISDAVILSKYTDGTLFVVKQDYASLQDITDSVNCLEKAGGQILGCILNDIRKGNRISGYNSRYYAMNKYGKAYYDYQ